MAAAHDHYFDIYLAATDRWACRCGVSMDRERGLWNADGTRQRPARVFRTLDDPGVRSGRELLSC